jgi:hypothetical protein
MALPISAWQVAQKALSLSQTAGVGAQCHFAFGEAR